MEQQVPCLTTALTGPLLQLEQTFLANQANIEDWFRRAWLHLPLPMTSSVDLRNAGFKVAPVDTNLFPAGFNNLNPAFMPLCIQAVQSSLQRYYPKCRRILLIPENHTRNPSYLESVATLQEILIKAGYEVRLGSLREDIIEANTLILPSGKLLCFEPVRREQDRLYVSDFSACLILLNNDLADGLPQQLQGLTQMITPPTALGWHARFKSNHFRHYDDVARSFAEIVDVDPWFINPLFSNCGQVDIANRQGEALLEERAEQLFTQIKRKYAEYNIQQKPFVVVKTDAGSYGMGVMMITDSSELTRLNRKQRQRMATSKGGQKISQVMLQEGIYSIETWGPQQAVAEPVVYLLGQYVVGGFYRVHTGRSATENLNAPGMQFEPLAFSETCNNPDITAEPDAMPNRFYLYGVIARLAMLAAAHEIKEVS